MHKSELIKRLYNSSYIWGSSTFATLQEGVHFTTGMMQVWAMTYWLPREDYGIWGYCASLLGMASILTLPGVNQVIAFGASRVEDGVLWKATRIRLVFGLLASVALWIMAIAHLWMGRTKAAYLLIIMGFSAPFQQAFESVDSYLMGSGNFRALFYRRLVMQTTLAIGVSLTAWATRSIVLCGTVLYGAGLILNGIIYIHIYKLRRNDVLPSSFTSMVRHFTAQSVGSVVSKSMERPLLSGYVTFGELAAYNLSQAALLPVGMGRLIDRILFSRLARSHDAIAVRTVLTGSWLLFLVGWPVYGVCALAVHLLVPIVLPHYQDSVPLAVILLLQLPFVWASKPGTSLLLARPGSHHIYHRLVWGIILGRLLFVLTGVVLAGMTGAAWGWVAVESITFVVMIVILNSLASAGESGSSMASAV
jgi:O-antigen/teichoic acid export membrane protein